MRRFSVALVASVFLIATASLANASSHGAAPADLSFIGMLVWEFQHFSMHMSMTLQAIQAWFVSPELGWGLLRDQTLCANQGQLTTHLFDTGARSLTTFASTILLMEWVAVQTTLFVWRHVRSLRARPFFRFA